MRDLFTRKVQITIRAQVLFAVFLLPAAASASVTLLLEQPYGKINLINPAGHSAVYLDHICAETPTRLRLCGPGELGVVLSRYDGVGGYDWIAIPLVPYLYSVASPDRIPSSVDQVQVELLRDAYRREYLAKLVPDDESGTFPPGTWSELIGSAYDRTIFGFRVRTSPEQDEALVAVLNDRRNVEHYNGAFSNCADFARVILNFFYPHAIRRNFIAGFGITSPKSVGRSLAHYARKHPEVGLDAFVIPQVKGSLPRSHPIEGVAEGLLTRYAIPMTVISPWSTAAVFAAYVGQGRFSMPRNAPVLDVNRMQAQEGDLCKLPEAFPTQMTTRLTLPSGSGSTVLRGMSATSQAQ